MTVVSNLSPSEHQERDRAIILKIFSSIGRCRFLEEKHFDACTALSGSGPAFACIFMEAMADGGVMMGLPRAEALELAAQSSFPNDRSGLIRWHLWTIPALQGAARMVLQGGAHPAQIKDSVTSMWIRLHALMNANIYSFPSAWRMYHCRSTGIRRWKSSLHYSSSYPNCYGTC